LGTIAAGTIAALGLLYVGARETSVFAVRTIDISGAPPPVRDAVRAAAEPFAGTSLVSLDGDALVRDLEALPFVRSASYDRAFPSTLRIFVSPEQPLAIVRLGPDRWIVSERGRLIRPAAADEEVRLPRIRLPGEDGDGGGAGSFVTDPTARALLGALAALPARFPARVGLVRLQQGSLTFALHAPWGDPELRLGEAVDVGVKLAVAALVLRALPADERASTDYLDVSVPERMVVGSNSQPEG
jgi:cell division protein FtsQ